MINVHVLCMYVLCVCMYVCMYVCTYVCMHAFMHLLYILVIVSKHLSGSYSQWLSYRFSHPQRPRQWSTGCVRGPRRGAPRCTAGPEIATSRSFRNADPGIRSFLQIK